MIKSSCIYNGHVIHKRFKPKKHFFKYKVFSLLIDLSESHLLEKELTLFSYNKFNILSFYDVDHGPRDGSSLTDWVKENVVKTILVLKEFLLNFYAILEYGGMFSTL